MNLLEAFTQEHFTGGVHTPPETRLLLYSLAVAMRAKRVLELGYDAGYTLLALAMSGAECVGVENYSDTGAARGMAESLLADYSNVTLINQEAIAFLEAQADESFDLIFVDDSHNHNHVAIEINNIRRILAPGGIAVFHDVIERNLWTLIERDFANWQRIMLPAISPHTRTDFGIGVVRKPGGTKWY